MARDGHETTRTPSRETARGVRALKRRKRAARRREASFGSTAFDEACSTAAAPTQVINIFIMVRHNCAKCGSTEHSTAKCTSDIELREECICSEVEGLEWCGNHITKDKWNAGYRIHNKCKNFLAGAVSLLTLIGTCIPGRRATIKAPKKTNSGTGETRDRLRDEAQLRGEARRKAEGGGRGGPDGKKVSTEASLKKKMTAADFAAIMEASLKPEKDGEGRWRIPRAQVIVKRIDLASPIRTRLVFRRPDAAGRSKRERSGDPTSRGSDEPTLATICAIDSLLYLCASSKHGLPIQIWDVELKFTGATWHDIRDERGVAAADVAYCWETSISKGKCSPCAEISRAGYAVADESQLKFEKKRNAQTGASYTVVSGDVAVSEAEQRAVLDERDPRLPLGFQLGPELRMGPFLRKDIWLWDMYAALCRAAGHENGGENNELIYLPLNSEALAFFFGVKFEHRAEPDTVHEIMFCQALGFEIYQLLKEDPECPIDEIIEERFPGKDPTKWDFSSFVRSAPSAPAAKAGRKRKAPLTEASNKK